MKIEHMPYLDLLERLEQMQYGHFLELSLNNFNFVFWRLNDCFRMQYTDDGSVCDPIPSFAGDMHIKIAITAEAIIDELLRCKILN